MTKYIAILASAFLLTACHGMKTDHAGKHFKKDGNPERAIVNHSQVVTRNAAEINSLPKQ